MVEGSNSSESKIRANFDAILQEYLIKFDKEHSINHEAFILRNPEFETELREYFEAEEKLEQLAGPRIGNTIHTPIHNKNLDQ